MAESLFRNQATNCQDQCRGQRKIGTLKFPKIQPVINTVDAISAMRESLTQKAQGVIRFSDDRARCINKFIQSDFELSRRKNIVRVRGETETDGKKLVNPES